MIKKISIYLVSFSLFLVSINAAFAAINNDPLKLLESVSAKIVTELKSNKATLKSNPNKVYSIAYKYVVPNADITVMSQRVLPPNIWQRATASEKLKFKTEFTKLLVKTYAGALSDYTSQTIKFHPIRGGFNGKSRVKVSSQIIRSDGPPIAVVYSLLKEPSGWKLYDMSVEGVSLLESFRSQFQSKLSQGNMKNLIGDLQKHNARI